MEQKNILLKQLEFMFTQISDRLNLPENTFVIKDNYSKTGAKAGELISTEIGIQEYAYPPDHSIAGTSLVLYIKPNRYCYELLVRYDRLSNLTLPPTADVKKTSDKLYEHILFGFEDDTIYKFIEDNIIHCLEHYSSSNSFGCCSRYRECSDIKKCIHPNTLYAKGCQYRENLEVGKIFY